MEESKSVIVNTYALLNNRKFLSPFLFCFISFFQKTKNFFRPDDFQTFLVGVWKRNLEWREFGGSFGFLRSSNTIIKVYRKREISCVIFLYYLSFFYLQIEEQHMAIGSEADSVKHLKWSFGQSLNDSDLRYGYTMKSIKDPGTKDVSFEWDYIGTPCKGQYIFATSVAIMNFFQKKSTVTVTYRVLDQNSNYYHHLISLHNFSISFYFIAISICVVEAEVDKPAIVQYGNMYRIDTSLYTEKK